jgi:hypothetical protein
MGNSRADAYRMEPFGSKRESAPETCTGWLRVPRLSPFQQLAVVLGAWVGAVVSSGAVLQAAVQPTTLTSVLVLALLLEITTSR